jgi:hypothetical protein
MSGLYMRVTCHINLKGCGCMRENDVKNTRRDERRAQPFLERPAPYDKKKRVI